MRTGSSCPLTPKGAYLILKVEPPPERTDGGIYLPDKAKRRRPTAIVKAIGPRVDQLHGFREGQRVFFYAPSAMGIVIGKELYVAINEDAVLAEMAVEIPDVFWESER